MTFRVSLSSLFLATKTSSRSTNINRSGPSPYWIKHRLQHVDVALQESCAHSQDPIGATMPWDYATNTPKKNYTKTFSNQYDQPQCNGCNELRNLFIELRREKQGEFGPVRIHENYRELRLCAEKCIACQVFNRGLLLQQITVQDSLDLEHESAAVYAKLIKQSDEVFLEISLGSLGVSASKIATILCTSENESTNLRGVVDGAKWQQLRTWMSACDSKHSCRNHRWSNRNPSWLIKILPGDRIQLVKGEEAAGAKDTLVRYVALSYCWGNPATINAKDPTGWERVLRAHTETQENGLPVPERLRPFSRTVYPETLRDAIKICEELGEEFLWVDQVCIISEWDDEAGKMHEIYGNSYFTLFACSADKAIDPLCTHRQAWQHPVKACRLFGYWLSNRDTTLAEIRLRNPLSRRGWILQEERLSPRILFWTAQRAYWSCCEASAIEGRLSKIRSQPPADGTSSQGRPQDFMLLTRSGDGDQMQEEWLELVASYTRRHLSAEKDRFRAISGLAVRYLSSGNPNAPQKNEYLAGLWRHNFARHLAWKVTHAVRPDHNLRTVAPTWSWASLPLCTEVDLRSSFEDSENFTLLEENRVQPNDTEHDIVARGASIRTVRVSGRLRRLVAPTSIPVPWDAIMPTGSDGVEKFDMPLDPSYSVHARSADGRLVLYEAHKAEVLCQLDYLEAQARDEEKWMIDVGENEETGLYCLEVGRASMLLLEEVEQGGECFRRVGVGLGYRKNFFEGHESQELTLE